MVSAVAPMPPMLAVPHKDVCGDVTPTEALNSLHTTGEYLFDLKWDGVRCLAGVYAGQVLLINRNGKDITYRYPDVAAALNERWPDDVLMLDGEIVVFDDQGKPDFGLVARRDRVGSEAKAVQAAKRLPATFVAFDILQHGTTDLTGTSLLGRRALLEHHVERGPGISVSPVSQDGLTMWQFCLENGLEGLIAKKLGDPYYGGRNQTWVKVKKTHRVSCIVTGMEEGNGKASGMMGKLHLAVYDEQGEPVTIGKVGTGFSDADRKAWWTNKHWAAGRLVIEVEYANVTTDGILRFPSYKGERLDLDPSDCTIEQLVLNANYA